MTQHVVMVEPAEGAGKVQAKLHSAIADAVVSAQTAGMDISMHLLRGRDNHTDAHEAREIFTRDPVPSLKLGDSPDVAIFMNHEGAALAQDQALSGDMNITLEEAQLFSIENPTERHIYAKEIENLRAAFFDAHAPSATITMDALGTIDGGDLVEYEPKKLVFTTIIPVKSISEAQHEHAAVNELAHKLGLAIVPLSEVTEETRDAIVTVPSYVGHIDTFLNVLPTGKAVFSYSVDSKHEVPGQPGKTILNDSIELSKTAIASAMQAIFTEGVFYRDAEAGLVSNFVTIGKSVIMTDSDQEIAAHLQENGYNAVQPSDYGLESFALTKDGGARCATNIYHTAAEKTVDTQRGM